MIDEIITFGEGRLEKRLLSFHRSTKSCAEGYSKQQKKRLVDLFERGKVTMSSFSDDIINEHFEMSLLPRTHQSTSMKELGHGLNTVILSLCALSGTWRKTPLDTLPQSVPTMCHGLKSWCCFGKRERTILWLTGTKCMQCNM